MLRLIPVLPFLVAATLILTSYGRPQASAPPGGASQTGAVRTGSLKEKIVFVRADPSVGAQSLRSVADLNLKSGATAGSNATPEYQAAARANAKANQIELMNPDGTGVQDLRVYGADPSLSPDGTRIVYCSIREDIYSQIYVMNADGTGQKRITNFKTGDACGPVWSHDAKKLAFYAFALAGPRRNPEIWVMDADGSNQKRLIDHGIDPAWSPNDRLIAYASNREARVFQISVMNSDGTNAHRITKHKGEDSNPAWAPDGASIAFASETEGDRRGLFIVAADGSEEHRLAFSKHEDFCFPAWSPDGKFIAFTALNRLGPQGIIVGEERPRCETWSGEYQIFTFDSEGKIHQLTDSRLSGMRASYGQVLSER